MTPSATTMIATIKSICMVFFPRYYKRMPWGLRRATKMDVAHADRRP